MTYEIGNIYQLLALHPHDSFVPCPIDGIQVLDVFVYVGDGLFRSTKPEISDIDINFLDIDPFPIMKEVDIILKTQ